MHKVLIIIPVFNEAEMIQKVISTLPKKIGKNIFIDIVVINDGSTDVTASILKLNNVKTITHIINRGLGAALGTGFQYALSLKYDFIITFDADGQHSSKDIPRIIRPLVDGEANVVIGSRLLDSKGMPLIRKLINIFSNITTFLLYKSWTTDSQSGLRGFTRKSLSRINIRTQRMEVSSEIFKEIAKNKFRVKEIPIQSIYTNYSLKKGQKISNAPTVFWKLFINRFA